MIEKNSNSDTSNYNILSQKEYQLVVKEKGYGGELSTLGKIAYFTEYFYGIKLTDQDIKNVIPLEKPTEEKSYKSGYEMGIVLVKQGFTKEDYKKFLENLNKKTKEKIERIEIVESTRHR